MKHLKFLVPVIGLAWAGCDSEKQSSTPNPVPAAKAAAQAEPATTNTAPAAELPSNTTNSAVAPRQFFVTGVVQKLQLDEAKAIVQHEEIPNFMEAMTMPFNIADTNEFSEISTNDQIHFRLVVEDRRSWIDRVTKVGSVAAMQKPRREFRRVRDVQPLKVGDTLPNYPLTNQFGKLFHTDDYRGQAMAFTFVFTRCPMPEFCPLMSRNFKEVYEEMSQDSTVTNWQLLSLSFDVEADSPRVLNGYAKIYGADSNKWSFATGALIEIDDITERFGLYFSRAEGMLNFDHNLRSVIVDPAGRIQSIYIGNTWKPTEFAKDLRIATGIRTPAQ
jgi:protein SCO1